MAARFGTTISALLNGLVRWTIVPVTGIIPWLVSSGLLFLGFVALWLAFFAALVVDQAALDAVWRTIGGLPLLVQGACWLLFLPLMGGLWVWATDWALALRLLLIGGIAAWNLLMFIPRRDAASPATAQ